ncbi:MAG: GntR family transcriptional regulator, partial [Pseudonocardiaceae bacterium]
MAKTGTGKYVAAAEAIRADIAGGALAPGEWLPSEAGIMTRYQVSRYGAREALKRLAGEGLIVTVDGKGSHVRPRRERATYAGLRALHQQTDPGGRVRYRDTELDQWHPVAEPGRYRATATMDLALSLGVPEHTPVFVHDRLLEHQPDPTPGTSGAGPDARRLIHRLYLPLATCTDIPALTEDPFRTPEDLYTLLTEAGRELRWIEHVRATTPTPDDTTTLTLPTGTPVLITRRVSTSPDGRPIAMEETRRSAADTQLTYPQTPTD